MLMLALDLLRAYLQHSTGSDNLGPLRVFQYITVRAGAALVAAFVLSLAFGPAIIARIRALGAGQIVRKATREGAISLHDMHGGKAGTPTMGGVIIMFALFVSVAIFCRMTSQLVLMLLAVSLAFGALGFRDDYRKVLKQNHLGLSPREKLFAQAGFGLLLGLALWQGEWPVVYERTGDQGYDFLLIPFLKDLYLPLGIIFVPYAALVMMCTSNAVNLTDGLDGLAIGVTLVNAAAFTVIAYLVSRPDYASYLYVPFVPGAGEVVVFGGALVGASMGFLWFNSHPAQVFMGDTGSMMLGGALGGMALMIKQEMLLVIIGGIFVIEAASVIIQVASFRLTGKRVFRMSPLHHHYEKLGLHESKIIIRFWTISALLALVGLATLKLR